MKKRHIDIIVTKIECDQVHFKIKQTHREEQFSNQSETSKFIAANGYVLYSLHVPEFGEDSKILFCLGKHEYDGTICTCNREEAENVRDKMQLLLKECHTK